MGWDKRSDSAEYDIETYRAMRKEPTGMFAGADGAANLYWLRQHIVKFHGVDPKVLEPQEVKGA